MFVLLLESNTNNYTMKLRSGKSFYNICYICNEHYSNERSSKCSKCDPNYTSYSWHTIYYGEEFQLKLKKYAEDLTAPDYYKRYLKNISNRNNLRHLYEALKLLRFDMELYLDAKFAYYLINHTGHGKNNEKIHLVCPMIVDWWNITHKNGWGSTEVCYYGNFEEPHYKIKSIPPPKTHVPPGGWNWRCIMNSSYN